MAQKAANNFFETLWTSLDPQELIITIGHVEKCKTCLLDLCIGPVPESCYSHGTYSGIKYFF